MQTSKFWDLTVTTIAQKHGFVNLNGVIKDNKLYISL